MDQDNEYQLLSVYVTSVVRNEHLFFAPKSISPKEAAEEFLHKMMPDDYLIKPLSVEGVHVVDGDR